MSRDEHFDVKPVEPTPKTHDPNDEDFWSFKSTPTDTL